MNISLNLFVLIAKGIFVFMMKQGEGWHEELIPFELTVNGKTYGNTSKRIPVWMQNTQGKPKW